jgi:hypothetical protein
VKRPAAILLAAAIMISAFTLLACSASESRQAQGRDQLAHSGAPAIAPFNDDRQVAVMASGWTSDLIGIPNRPSISVESADPTVVEALQATNDGVVQRPARLTARSLGRTWITVRESTPEGGSTVLWRFQVEVVRFPN